MNHPLSGDQPICAPCAEHGHAVAADVEIDGVPLCAEDAKPAWSREYFSELCTCGHDRSMHSDTVNGCWWGQQLEGLCNCKTFSLATGQRDAAESGPADARELLRRISEYLEAAMAVDIENHWEPTFSAADLALLARFTEGAGG